MLDTAKRLLQIIEDHDYKAYIVGGFVRDYILGIESNDIDIATSATPMEIKEIFKDACLPNEEYGSIRVIKKKVSFEITTFRREKDYLDKRRPSIVEYTNSLMEDLSRRDFTMNALCMDKNGEILDLLNGKDDILNHKIQTIGNSYYKFSEDSLRILRAVRFATTLNFELSEEIKQAIFKTKHFLKYLSYERKKEELDKIFANKYVQKGIKLLLELGLDDELELTKLKSIPITQDLIAIWAYLDVMNIYPFTSVEKSQIKEIKLLMTQDVLNPIVLYNYSLYACTMVAPFQNVSKKKVIEKYHSLPIHTKGDIVVNSYDIMNYLQRKSGPYLKIIYKDLEEAILSFKIPNKETNIYMYLDKYKKEGAYEN
ncbi:MAG: CCA tRNA nucleotidyltransferase [Bacilli bacterium]